VGRTRTPKPVTVSSQTVNSKPLGLRASTARLVILCVVISSLLHALGQHRGNTEMEFAGNPG
jgi:hypothetical protein